MVFVILDYPFLYFHKDRDAGGQGLAGATHRETLSSAPGSGHEGEAGMTPCPEPCIVFPLAFFAQLAPVMGVGVGAHPAVGQALQRFGLSSDRHLRSLGRLAWGSHLPFTPMSHPDSISRPTCSLSLSLGNVCCPEGPGPRPDAPSPPLGRGGQAASCLSPRACCGPPAADVLAYQPLTDVAVLLLLLHSWNSPMVFSLVSYYNNLGSFYVFSDGSTGKEPVSQCRRHKIGRASCRERV